MEWNMYKARKCQLSPLTLISTLLKVIEKTPLIWGVLYYHYKT